MGRGLVVIGLVLGSLAMPAAVSADPVDHAVSGTASDQHVLIHLVTATCDPAAGDPSQPKDPAFFCRYNLRGDYVDSSSEGFLGAGQLSGRFTLDTRSWVEGEPGYGCFAVNRGVIKFTTDQGGRLRFRISRRHSSICQAFDGVQVNGPDRTYHLILSTTVTDCSDPYCGTTGRLTWDSTATFDQGAPEGIVQYLDTATFQGTLTTP